MNLSKANSIVKGIGLYQSINAIIGLGICCYHMFNYQVNLFWWLYLFIAILLQLFFLKAGINLLQLKSKGFALTVYSQLLQLVSFNLLGVGYKVTSGIGLFIGLDLTHTIEFTWLATFNYIGLGKVPFTQQVLSINLVALLLLLLTEHLKEVRENAANMIFVK